MNNTTIYNLNSWAKHIFEKMGWMILAHHNSKKTELKSYVEDIDYLLEKVGAKIEFLKNSASNESRLHDMKILKNNLHLLWALLNDLFF